MQYVLVEIDFFGRTQIFDKVFETEYRYVLVESKYSYEDYSKDTVNHLNGILVILLFHFYSI